MIKKKIKAISKLNIPIKIFYKVHSTQDLCKKSHKESLLVIAKKQTNGRGTNGRKFFSNDGGVYFSYLFNKQVKKEDLFTITFSMGISILYAFKELNIENLGIKWVNDIFCADKKIAGILTEAEIENDFLKNIIIGVGINTCLTAIPKEIKDTAGAVYLKPSQRYFLIGLILKYFNQIICLDKETIVTIYRQHQIMIGKVIIYYENNVEKTGLVKDISYNGNLIIEVNEELKELNSGFIKIKSWN